jgi:negative regulator of replication initiation
MEIEMQDDIKLEDYSLYLLQAREQKKAIEEFASKREYFEAKMAVHKFSRILDMLYDSLNNLYNRSN